MNITYYLRRLSPFFLLFISLETIMRAVFLIQERQNLDTIALTLKSLAIGFCFDIAVFTYFIIPIALYLLLLPQKKHGSKLDRTISTGIYFFLTYTFLFTCLSEWFFWDEFATRFNFIAVDYLVYTHEVIGNIWESYPVLPLLAAIGVVGMALSYRFYKRFQAPMNSPTFLTRFAMCSLAILCAYGQFSVMNTTMTEISHNQYTTEIAKNGIFELFSAYRRNELKFDQFYATQDQTTLNTLLKSELDNSETKDANILTRMIHAEGSEKHHNIVLITVESLSANYMKAFGNQENLTPYLDQLAKDSLFFTNFYAIGTRTVYGLTGITLSIPPLPGNAIVRRPHNEKLFSLGSVLNGKGYVSKFIYGGFGYFDNMNYFFANNGYQIVDRTNLSPEEITFANVWGVADEDLLNRVLKESDASFTEGKPFFHMIMTTSNHRPYSYPEGKIDIPSKTGRKGAVKYTDYAIGQFIEQAKTKPWFDNTIFVVVADHTAGSGGKNEIEPRRYHIPLIIYAPKLIQAKQIDTLSSQIDVAPTLLGMLNLQYESRFYGQNLLNNPKPRAFISNFQKIGYLTDEQLLILKPGKILNFYQKEGDEFVLSDNQDDSLTRTALSYLQTANEWKTLNQEIVN